MMNGWLFAFLEQESIRLTRLMARRDPSCTSFFFSKCRRKRYGASERRRPEARGGNSNQLKYQDDDGLFREKEGGWIDNIPEGV